MESEEATSSTESIPVKTSTAEGNFLEAEDGAESTGVEKEDFQFVIEISNLPKSYGSGHVKEIFKKNQLEHKQVKMKGAHLQCFATFECEEDRVKAIRILKLCQVKGTFLDAKVVTKDQLISKKRRAAEADTQEEDKRARTVEPVEPQLGQIALKHAPYQGKTYVEQLELKKNVIDKALRLLTTKIRMAHICTNDETSDESEPFDYIKHHEGLNAGKICPLDDLIQSPVRDKYRNMCDFIIGVNPETQQLTVGFRYKKGSCAVGPISHLAFIPDAMKTAVQLFEAHFKSTGRQPYEPDKNPSGFWRLLQLRTNSNGQILALVSVHPQDLTDNDMEKVKTDLRSLIEGTPISSLYFHSSKKPDEEPLIVHLDGPTHLTEKLCGLELAISPLASFPVNTLAAEVLYNKIVELALLYPQVDSDTDVLNMCCGSGTIGLLFAKICRRVFCTLTIPSAVEGAKVNAETNGIFNCDFVTGNAGNLLTGFVAKAKKDGKKIAAIVEPPKNGLDTKTIQCLRSTESINHVIVLSFNLSKTIMDSLTDLCRPESRMYRGLEFVPVKAVPFDVGPDTRECAILILFQRPWNYLD